jgi:hypothetical protein
VVSRPGRVPYETKMTIAKREHKAIAVPNLALPVTVNKGRTRIGQILAFTGGGAVIAGGALGLVANSRYNAEFDGPMPHCTKNNGHPTCDAIGQPATERARTIGNFGTGFVVGGAVIAGIGAYLWFFAPHDEKSPVAIVPQFDAQQAGVVAVGRF